MPLVNLPTEILTTILSKLDIPSAIKCQLVCTRLREVASSDAVLKLFCHKLGLLNPGETIEDLRKPALSTPANNTSKTPCDGQHYSAWEMSGRDKQELESYKTLLSSSWRLHHTMERADLSHEGGTNYAYAVEPWRIKVDHIDNVILATSATGSQLHVINMVDGRDVVTELNTSFLPRTHLEVDQGWIVWTIDPDTFQIACFERHVDTPEPRRARIVEHHELRAKHPINAYRLKFPHLLVGSGQGYATVYDITSGEVVSDIALKTTTLPVRLRKVEFDHDFIWVALAVSNSGPGCLQTYCRRTGRFLWDLSPQSSAVQCAVPYRFPPSPYRSYDDDEPDPQRETHFAPGRCEEFVDLYRYLQDDEEEMELMIGLDEWHAIQPDPKTGCLCLLSRQTLVVIPDYKRFVQPSEDVRQIDNQQTLLLLHDESYHHRRRLPSWVREGPDMMQAYLSVAAGRAAFVAKNGVALVDLEKFLGRHGPRWHPTDDPRGRSISERYYYEAKCVNVYTSPYVFNSDMASLFCLELTSTHLAWVGTYQSVQTHPIPNVLRERGVECESVFTSQQRPTVIWIDFAKLQDKKHDEKRVRADTERAEAMRACQEELDRRMTTQKGKGKYTLASGQEVEGVSWSSKDTVSLLLNIGEFADLSRWIDWDKVAKKGGSRTAAKLRVQVKTFQDGVEASSNASSPLLRWGPRTMGPAAGVPGQWTFLY